MGFIGDPREPSAFMSSGEPPVSNILYRETIRYSAEGERKYIRYYDGRGHFGHVWLRLIPHPGEPCTVSCDSACNLPEACCQAAHQALTRRFAFPPRNHLSLIGCEVRLMGGSYLNRHSYPEAYAHAAHMAFDEAFHQAGPMVVEPYTGIEFVVDLEDLVWTVKVLHDLLGELHTTQRVTQVVQLRTDVPVRLVGKIRSMGMHISKQLPLPRDRRYRPLLAPRDDSAFSGDLVEWT